MKFCDSNDDDDQDGSEFRSESITLSMTMSRLDHSLWNHDSNADDDINEPDFMTMNDDDDRNEP